MPARVLVTGVRAKTGAPLAEILLAEGVAVRVFEWRTRVLVHAAAQEAAMYIGPTIGVVEESAPGAERCIVTIGGDPDWVARFLAGLPVDFEILDPPEVREELRALAERLLSRLASNIAADLQPAPTTIAT